MDPYNFDSPDADVILRPSGANPGEFRAHKCILAMASSVFSTMFSLPQSESTKLPVIDMSENRTTLDSLLRLLYPIQDPSFKTLEDLGPVIDAAMKYEITVVSTRLRALLVSPAFLENQPLQVYAIATHWEFEEEMKLASAHTLSVTRGTDSTTTPNQLTTHTFSQPSGVDIINSPSADTLNNIATSHYRRLLIFHLERASKAQHILDQVSPKQPTCSACRGYVERWHEIYKSKARDELSLRPTSSVICSFDFIAPIADSVDGSECSMTSCRRAGRKLEVYRTFLELLKKHIDQLPSTI